MAHSPSTEVRAVFETHPVTRHCGAAGRETLARLAEIRSYAANDWLLRQGEEPAGIGLPLTGLISIELHVPHRGSIPLLTVGPRELLGWSGFLPGGHSQASARALEPTTILWLPAGPLRAACEADHDLGYRLSQGVIQAMSTRLTATRLQLLDLFGAAPSGPLFGRDGA